MNPDAIQQPPERQPHEEALQPSCNAHNQKAEQVGPLDDSDMSRVLRKPPRLNRWVIVALVLAAGIVTLSLPVVGIGTVVGIQRAREAQARAAAANNLQQLRLSAHEFQEEGQLPVAPAEPAPPRDPWAAHILPFVEQDDLFRLQGVERDPRTWVNPLGASVGCGARQAVADRNKW